MKIVFWNTARGSSMISERLDLVMENCIALAHGRPELIVLCEGQKGTRKQIRNKGGLPGYSLVKPGKLFGGGYGGDTTLRYVIFARDNVPCVAWYCQTGNARPAVHITVNHFPLLVIHAPSVTTTVKPQRLALKEALITPHGEPAVVFGDFNVDAFNKPMRTQFVNLLSEDLRTLFDEDSRFIARYDDRNPTRPSSGKALDWALVNQKYTSSVKVSVMKDTSTRNEMDDSSDDDFVPEIISTGKSDHEAILIEIT